MKNKNSIYLIDFLLVIALLVITSGGLFTALILSLVLVVIKSMLDKYSNLLRYYDWTVTKTILISVLASVVLSLIKFVL